ncbi:MAG: precorrin-3B C(17)-methyltransferase [Rhodospirillaceae bacterium]|nr:precorrin-3B C(17)-methyltransferase [Rhodospirillaceae bacterium]
MNTNSKGTLIGVGLGPGDPALLTLAARDAVVRAKIICYIHASNSTSVAKKIATDFIADGVTEIAISVDMQANQGERRKAYDAGASEILSHLKAGKDVIFLCEGDPLFYGSFVHLAQKINQLSGGDFKIKSIPGVSSINAAAAAAGMALASDNETFAVIPATLNRAALSAALAGNGAVALIKIGNNLEKLKQILKTKNRLDGAVLVTNASGMDEKIEKLSDVTHATYFSLVLIPPVISSTESVPHGAAIVIINQAGVESGVQLKNSLPGAKLFSRFATEKADELFLSTTETLKNLFTANTPIVAVAASGIVIRALAGLLNDKKTEPPVIAVSSDGAHAVPLLGGHNGANRLARACANGLGGAAAITTAGETEFGIALDDPPLGWVVANPNAAKGVMAKMLAGEIVNLEVAAGKASWLNQGTASFNMGKTDAKVESVLVTEREIANPEKTLVIHPPVLALGVGCERGTDADELYSLALEALNNAGLSKNSIACVCSLDLKSDEPAVLELAKRLGVPLKFFTAPELEAQTTNLANPSDIVFAEVGCHGVCEGAALAACGLGGKLIVEKQKSKRATVAIGQSIDSISPESIGHGQGRLYIVGTGPGRDGWRTPDATRVLSLVTDVVGYELYLDLVADLIKGKTRHTSQLAQEEARVRMALDLAAAGRDVALVSSGDPGIYAMAALAFELLDKENNASWNRLEIEVLPGISAFQATSARIGAPMGHDFCLISLSDLLTPWEVIEQRLRAAAQGGFAVAFYNPVSKRRTKQLEIARDILLGHRDPDTPVILGRNLGRDGENIRVITLAELSSSDADMLTMVIVGGPETKTIKRGEKTYVYTPRGYSKKMKEGAKND